MKDDLRDLLTLYLYNDLDEDQREELETRLETDSGLAEALETERRFLETLHQRKSQEVSEATVAECRHDLMRSVYREKDSPRHWPVVSGTWWRNIIGSAGSMRFLWQPSLALALLAIGFFAGRGAERLPGLAGPDVTGLEVSRASLGILPGSLRDIQSVEVDPESGHVAIVVEEVTRRTIRGLSQEPGIQDLLITTVRDYPISGVRLDSVDALASRAYDREVRRALLTTVVEDENPGVRLKALEALKAQKENRDVRAALVRILTGDENPGMRVQAIEMLTENPDRELIGVLQELVEREPNNYIRLRSQRTLHDLNASVDRF